MKSFINIEKLFFLLIRIAIEQEDPPKSISINDKDWLEIYKLARKHALVGTIFIAIEKLSYCKPPKQLLLRWIAEVDNIKRKNEFLNKQVIDLTNFLTQEGFRSVILKGQGLAPYHTKPQYRTPGDIDIWIDGSREKIIKLALRFSKQDKIVYHHTDFLYNGIEVEAHFTPSWMYSFRLNCRLQQYFKNISEEQFKHHCAVLSDEGDVIGYIQCPTRQFNQVYLLVHIFRHIYQEGIGLRQLLDYYYILRQGTTKEEANETRKILRHLKLQKFCSAIMYILNEIFGLEEKYMIEKPNSKIGKLVMEEILMGGNFGTYAKNSTKQTSGKFSLFIAHCKKNLRYIQYFPSETINTPIFKIWHWFWRYRMTRKASSLASELQN